MARKIFFFKNKNTKELTKLGKTTKKTKEWFAKRRIVQAVNKSKVAKFIRFLFNLKKTIRTKLYSRRFKLDKKTAAEFTKKIYEIQQIYKKNNLNLIELIFKAAEAKELIPVNKRGQIDAKSYFKEGDNRKKLAAYILDAEGIYREIGNKLAPNKLSKQHLEQLIFESVVLSKSQETALGERFAEIRQMELVKAAAQEAKLSKKQIEIEERDAEATEEDSEGESDYDAAEDTEEEGSEEDTEEEA
ncbi:MAG: hypothetical protein V1824_00705 [archaeon]